MSLTQQLRIITWNCRNGPFIEKIALLDALKPDLAILQEIPNPGKENDEHCIWYPSRLTDKKGVAVISSPDLKMSCTLPSGDLPEIFIPVKISGKYSFNLLAVWTQHEMKYIESFQPILSAYRDFLYQTPSIIAGDFNSNVKWDKQYKKFNHSKLISTLDAEFNLVSAYHQHKKIIPGQNEESTFFMYGHEDKPFHIDYCFVPKVWNIDNVTIGSWTDWCKDGKSDHCPLIVDLQVSKEIPQSTTKVRKSGQDRFCAEIEIVR